MPSKTDHPPTDAARAAVEAIVGALVEPEEPGRDVYKLDFTAAGERALVDAVLGLLAQLRERACRHLRDQADELIERAGRFDAAMRMEAAIQADLIRDCATEIDALPLVVPPAVARG